MRFIFLIAFLATSCSSLPTGIGEYASSNYYIYRKNQAVEAGLAPIMSGLAPLALFKRASVGVDQGLLGFTPTQLALIREASAYVNEVLNEDVLFYAKDSPDIKISPYEAACCFGEASTWLKDNKMHALIEIKTVQTSVQFYATVVHELGHVLGLGHTEATGSLMSENSEDPPVSSFNELEVKTLQYLRSKRNI